MLRSFCNLFLLWQLTRLTLVDEREEAKSDWDSPPVLYLIKRRGIMCKERRPPPLFGTKPKKINGKSGVVALNRSHRAHLKDMLIALLISTLLFLSHTITLSTRHRARVVKHEA